MDSRSPLFEKRDGKTSQQKKLAGQFFVVNGNHNRFCLTCIASHIYLGRLELFTHPRNTVNRPALLFSFVAFFAILLTSAVAQKVKPIEPEDWKVIVTGISVAPVKKDDGSFDAGKLKIAGKYQVLAVRKHYGRRTVERFYAAATYGEKKEGGKMFYFETLASTMLSPVNRLPGKISFSSKVVDETKGRVWLIANRFGGPLNNMDDGDLHYFDARFTSHAELRKDQCFVLNFIENEAKKVTKAKVAASFVFETPIPEFSAAVKAKYGLTPKFRYKVTYLDKDGNEKVVKEFKSIGSVRRGIQAFIHTWKIEDGDKAVYKVVRQYLKDGSWVSEEGADMAGGHTEIEIPLLKKLGGPPPLL